MNTQITDEQAFAALTEKQTGRAQTGDTFATRTILCPFEIERKPGEKKIVIRPYVIMGQYYSKRKWEKALDVERRYKKINEAYREDLLNKGLPLERDVPANPLNVTPIKFK